MMNLNTTVVGCGAAAQKLYRKPLQRLEREGILRVAGLVDRHGPHAQAMHSFFPRAALYDDLEHALKGGRSELSLILSPPPVHAEQTILALQHQNHVLCEKPMATTERECSEMMAAARAAHRVLGIAMIRRFFPAFAALREWIVHNRLGEIRRFSYREGKVFDWDVKTAAGFSKHRSGGTGVLYDIGPHVIDCLMWLFGVPEVASSADDALGDGVEGNVFMELATPVCQGSVQLSWDSPLVNELRVVGSKEEAVLRVDRFDKLAVKGVSGFVPVPANHAYAVDLGQPCRKTISPKTYTQSMYCQLMQMVRAIRFDEPPAVTADVGRTCVSVIESARRQAEPLEMAWLDPEQQQAYRTRHWTVAS